MSPRWRVSKEPVEVEATTRTYKNISYNTRTILSNTSLGIVDHVTDPDVEEREKFTYGFYINRGIKIIRRQVPTDSRLFPVILAPPVKGWFPSSYANFKFSKEVEMDPVYLIKIIPYIYNPGVWKSKQGYITLRVPKDKEERIKEILNKRKLWYDRVHGIWKKRVKDAPWSMYWRKKYAADEEKRKDDGIETVAEKYRDED